jgi:hypothetical protein
MNRLPLRRRLAAGLLCLVGLGLLPWPAAAQLRSVAVPAEAGVIVAPRGQASPRMAAAPRSLPVGEAAAPLVLSAGSGLAAPLIGVLLPTLAGALLGTTLAGGGGGGSGPVRTR